MIIVDVKNKQEDTACLLPSLWDFKFVCSGWLRGNNVAYLDRRKCEQRPRVTHTHRERRETR